MASGGKKKDSSRSRSNTYGEQASFDRTFVDPSQQPFLQDLMQQAQGFVQSQMANNNVQGLADQFGQQGQDIMALLQQQNVNPAAAQLMNFKGGIDPESMSMADLTPQIDNLGADINRQLQRQLGGSGGVNTQAALSGSLGGGRNQVAQGIANEGALNAFARQSGDMRLNEYQRVQNSQLQAMMANQSAELQAQGLGGQLMGQQNALNQQGLNSAASMIPQLFNMGMAPGQYQQGLLQFLQGMIGDPTVLSEGASRGYETSMSTSRGKGSGSNLSILGG